MTVASPLFRPSDVFPPVEESTTAVATRLLSLDATQERFVRSFNDEYLNQMIIFGERRTREVIDEYAEHYHLDRPHQGLGNRLINDSPSNETAVGEVRRTDRLGGLLRSYRRVAAGAEFLDRTASAGRQGRHAEMDAAWRRVFRSYGCKAASGDE